MERKKKDVVQLVCSTMTKKRHEDSLLYKPSSKQWINSAFSSFIRSDFPKSVFHL